MMFEQGLDLQPRARARPAITLHDAATLGEIYLKTNPKYSGRVTVPVLWDKKRGTIVNNESSEIIRMFNSAFNALTGDTRRLLSGNAARRDRRASTTRVYDNINNGVYRCGFATTQEAYEEAFAQLFETLDLLEGRLSTQRYLAGNTVTEADWRLFPTLIRFDAVYVGHFKCNLRRIDDYPQLVELHARALSVAGRRRDGRYRAVQAALLRQPQDHQSDRHRAGRAGARFQPAARSGKVRR